MERTHPVVGEISIGDKWIGATPAWLRSRDGSWELTEPGAMLPAAEVLAAIEAHRQAGARALLVTLGMCGGGAVGESMEIVAALRRFASEVGPVIAHVSGVIGSTGPFLALAADFVIMAERARMIFHAAFVGQVPDPEATRALAPHLAARCAASEEEALVWLSRGLPGSDEPVTIAESDACLAHGLADAVGTLEQARFLARMVAAGSPLPATARADLLRMRQVSPRMAAPATNILKTSNYTEDGLGNPTAGAKLDHTGVALKVAPGNFQIGGKALASFGTVRACAQISLAAGTYTLERGTNIGSIGRDTTWCSWGITLRVAVSPNLTIDSPARGMFPAMVIPLLYDETNEVSQYCKNYRVYHVGTQGGGSFGFTYWNNVFIGFTNAAGTIVDPNTVTARLALLVVSLFPD